MFTNNEHSHTGQKYIHFISKRRKNITTIISVIDKRLFARLHTPPGWTQAPSFQERFLPVLTLTIRPYFLKPETPSAKGNPATPALVRGHPGHESKIRPLDSDMV